MIIIIIAFILIQEIGFTKSLLNWKTVTGPNSAQLPLVGYTIIYKIILQHPIGKLEE